MSKNVWLDAGVGDRFLVDGIGEVAVAYRYAKAMVLMCGSGDDIFWRVVFADDGLWLDRDIKPIDGKCGRPHLVFMAQYGKSVAS